MKPLTDTRTIMARILYEHSELLRIIADAPLAVVELRCRRINLLSMKYKLGYVEKIRRK